MILAKVKEVDDDYGMPRASGDDPNRGLEFHWRKMYAPRKRG